MSRKCTLLQTEWNIEILWIQLYPMRFHFTVQRSWNAENMQKFHSLSVDLKAMITSAERFIFMLHPEFWRFYEILPKQGATLARDILSRAKLNLIVHARERKSRAREINLLFFLIFCGGYPSISELFNHIGFSLK